MLWDKFLIPQVQLLLTFKKVPLDSVWSGLLELSQSFPFSQTENAFTKTRGDPRVPSQVGQKTWLEFGPAGLGFNTPGLEDGSCPPALQTAVLLIKASAKVPPNPQ